ncbi:MAG: GerAB/ArcD/ProY family transporter, partial [Deltaproteobacteria bacterium]
NGYKDILIGGFSRVSIFSAILILYMLPPFLKTYDNFKKVGYLSLTASNFFIISSVFVFTIVFPYPVSSEIYIPIYALSRLLFFGRFLDRLESIFMPIWVLAGAIYLSAALLVACYSTMRAFDLPYMTPLIIPLSILVYTASFLPQSIFETLAIESSFRTWGMFPGFGLPIILLIIAVIRKKRAPESKSPSA